MPTFDYKCKKCENVQEEWHSINANPEVKCTECNSECERIISGGTGFILKGDGFTSASGRMKKQMSEKNKKMKNVMNDRYNSGEGRTHL